MDVERIADGLWRWTDGDRASTYAEAEDAVVLVDPAVPAHGSGEDDRFWHALDRDVERLAQPVAVVLTSARHARSAADVAERYADTAVWAPADEADRIGATVTHRFADGAALPAGGVALVLRAAGEAALHLPAHRALAVGDVLVATAGGELRLRRPGDAGLRADVARLARLDVDRVLPGHGAAVTAGGTDAIRRAAGRAG